MSRPRRRAAPTRPGDVVSIQVDFSENVTVTGTPQLALNSGATVDYASGTGTSTLTLHLHRRPAARRGRPRLHRTASLTLNGGTIKDAATNKPRLTLAAPGAAGSLGNAKNIVIDTTAPTVTSVTSEHRERLLQGRRDRLDPGRLHRERRRHRHAAARAQERCHGRLRLGLRHLDADLHVHRRRRRELRPTSTTTPRPR